MSQAEKRQRRRNRKKWRALMARIEAGAVRTAERSEARKIRRAKLGLS